MLVRLILWPRISERTTTPAIRLGRVIHWTATALLFAMVFWGTMISVMEINRYRLQESQYLQQVRSDQKILEPPPQAAPTHTSESLPSADKLLASVKPPPDATHSPDAKAKPTADEVFGPVTPPPDKVDAQTNAAFAKALAGADGTPTPTDDAFTNALADADSKSTPSKDDIASIKLDELQLKPDPIEFQAGLMAWALGLAVFAFGRGVRYVLADE